MNIAAFIAWRYLRFKHKDANVSFMIKVCFLGIFIGTFALMLTLIIMDGFEKVIHEKMQGINAQIIISAPGNRLDYQELRDTLIEEYGTLLKGVSGHSLKQSILNKDDAQNVIILKGIDAEHEAQVTNLMEKIIARSNIIEASDSFEPLVRNNGIIIGHKTAQAYQLSCGDDMTLMIPEPGGKKKILLKNKKFTVRGIFNIGLEEYDSNFAFISLDLLQDLYDEKGVDFITLMLDEPKTFASLGLFKKISLKLKRMLDADLIEHKTLALLKARFPNLQIQSWKELYPALVSSLKIEKYLMFLIIMLISLVASMNMISLLFMQIQQKQRDIAILKAMGISNTVIRNVFLYLGLTVTLFGSCMGLAAAALVGYFIEQFPLIELPDVYYVTHIPVCMDVEMFVIVFIVTVLIGFLATWYPAKRSKNIVVADVLRNG